MSEWTRKTIAECASDELYSTQIGPFGKALTPEEYTLSGVPLLRGVNVNHGRFYDDGFVFISEETANRLHKYESYPGDVLLVHKGTLGQIGLMPKNRKYHRYIMGNSMLRVKCDEKKLMPEYLYYWLCSREGQHYLLSRVSQVGVPQIQKPLATLREASLLVPSLDEQKAITHILETIDNKIENLRRQNETLEAIAQTLFKHWFIDFEFPDADGKPYKSSGGEMVDSAIGDIPEGWQSLPLDEIAEFLNGLALQKYPPENERDFLPVIKIRELRTGVTDSTDKASINVPSKYIIDNGDIIFSWSGSLDVVIWNFGKGALNQHLFKVDSDKFPKWFYYYWTLNHLSSFQQIAKSKATTMGHIQRKHLTEALCNVPDTNFLKQADKVFFPMLQRIINNALQVQTLTKTRDALLPKLMSGQLRIEE